MDISPPVNTNKCVTILQAARISLTGNNTEDISTIAEHVFVKYALSLEAILLSSEEEPDFVYNGSNRLIALKCACAAAMIKDELRMDFQTDWPSFETVYKQKDNLAHTVGLIEKVHTHLYAEQLKSISTSVKDEFISHLAVGFADLFFSHALISREGRDLIKRSEDEQQQGLTQEGYAEITFDFYAVILPAIAGIRQVMNFLRAMSFVCFGEVSEDDRDPDPISYQGYDRLVATKEHIDAIIMPSSLNYVDISSDTEMNMSQLIDIGRLTNFVQRDGFFLFDALLGLSVNPLERLSQGEDESDWFGIDFDMLRELTTSSSIHSLARGICWFNAAADVLAVQRKELDSATVSSIKLVTIVFEKEQPDDLLLSTGFLQDRTLGGVARALHEEWMDTNNVTGSLLGLFTAPKHRRRISAGLIKLLYKCLGTILSEEEVRGEATDIEEVYRIYQNNGLSVFFKQAVRCVVFSAISNHRLVKQFFTDNIGHKADVKSDKYSQHILSTISEDFGYVPVKKDLMEAVKIQLLHTISTNNTDITGFMRVVDEEENSELETVSLLDISLDYISISPAYNPRSRIPVVLQ